MHYRVPVQAVSRRKSDRKLPAFPAVSPSVFLSGTTAPLRVGNLMVRGVLPSWPGGDQARHHHPPHGWPLRAQTGHLGRSPRKPDHHRQRAEMWLQSIAFTSCSPKPRFPAISRKRKSTVATGYVPPVSICECGCTVQVLVQIARMSSAVSSMPPVCRPVASGQERGLVTQAGRIGRRPAVSRRREPRCGRSPRPGRAGPARSARCRSRRAAAPAPRLPGGPGRPGRRAGTGRPR